jgi:POT family proton-dependent oligopeptide transporter
MLLSTFWFFTQRNKLGAAGMPPGRKSKNGMYQLNFKDRLDILYYVFGSAAIVWSALKLWSHISIKTQTILIWALFTVGGILLAFIIIRNTKGHSSWSKLSVILILAFFNIFFWSGYEQAGGTFNLFAEHNTNRMTSFGEFPASWFQSVPALFIVLLAPLFAIIWIKLKSRNKEPSTPVKFSFGLILMSAGFVIMNLAAKHVSEGGLVSPMWLLMVYFMHTLGELCLSPIGLSMVTKLAPKKIVSVMMGIWFASIALANYLAGVLENLLNTYLPNIPLYIFLTFTTLIAAILLLTLSPILRKMMSNAQ